MLMSLAECHEFIENKDASEVAKQLRNDQKACASGKLPSALAIALKRLPQSSSDKIAAHLLGDGNAAIPWSILRLQYTSILEGIRSHIDRLGQVEKVIYGDLEAEVLFTPSELRTALKVLRGIVRNTKLRPHSFVSDVINIIQSKLDPSNEPQSKDKPALSPAKGGQQETRSIVILRTCYICHISLSNHASHPGYSSLCSTCGSFNISSSQLSLPSNLRLEDKTVLVTGGRLNLGFLTALRLLRCGAHVIVTSRYPRDAEERYRDRLDFSEWQSRLRVIGADFRTAKDVFRLVTVVKRVLAGWAYNGVSRLDILINNAAQTLTDSIAAEQRAIAQETQLQQNKPSILLVGEDRGYVPNLRGGVRPLALDMASACDKSDNRNVASAQAAQPFRTSVSGSDALSKTSSRPNSSWTQTLPEIPYEDVISAHSINTFVPLILIRELLPLMGKAPFISSPHPSQNASTSLDPAGYIVNVSSREGIFDSLQVDPFSSVRPEVNLRKTQHHVHTNMSKAALNMITETEAAACWHDRRICMNSVDPGYMSAAPGFGRNIPIGWEDGVGRVLWPIAVGWGKEEPQKSCGRAVWGKFLKHYRPSQWGGERF